MNKRDKLVDALVERVAEKRAAGRSWFREAERLRAARHDQLAAEVRAAKRRHRRAHSTSSEVRP